MNLDLRKTLDPKAPLGQTSPYPKHYDKSLLYPVKRAMQREAMGFPADVRFEGGDIWNCYELSWLNLKGKPQRSVATFILPANSTYLAESKSVKLYLNSLNAHRFASESDFTATIERDLSALCEADITLELNPKSLQTLESSANFYCLDELDISIDTYERDPNLLVIDKHSLVEESVVSHLFKSHCLCTGQPDWGSIFISYEGPKIERESLLKYLISYHDHVGFAENCIEQIYVDLLSRADFSSLSIFGRFTRRGGIDINPYRGGIDINPYRHSANGPMPNMRLIYQ